MDAWEARFDPAMLVALPLPLLLLPLLNDEDGVGEVDLVTIGEA